MRRFTCRRGPLRELCSDQGTNFVGAKNELKAALQEMDNDKIKAEFLKENTNWIREPATASNFGGDWERQIRSGRNITTNYCELSYVKLKLLSTVVF